MHVCMYVWLYTYTAHFRDLLATRGRRALAQVFGFCASFGISESRPTGSGWIRAKKGQLLENFFYNSSIEIQPCDHDRVRGIYNSFTTQQTGNHVFMLLRIHGCKDAGLQRPTERLLSMFLASNEPLSVGIFGNWQIQLKTYCNAPQRTVAHCNALLHRFLRNADGRELRTNFDTPIRALSRAYLSSFYRKTDRDWLTDSAVSKQTRGHKDTHHTVTRHTNTRTRGDTDTQTYK